MSSVKVEGRVLVIGAGLAGSEAAFFLARQGVQVVLLESKRLAPNPSQKMKSFAELVCTNSLKSMNPDSGHGLLKHEMKALGSIVLELGYKHAVPAGDALAVDRELFSQAVTEVLENHPNIEYHDENVASPIEAMKRYNCSHAIVATGPLTTESLQNWLEGDFAKEDFYFYDAIAPVVDGDSLDYSKLYFKDRHTPIEESEEDEGSKADYLNAPMTKEEYENFISELVAAEKVGPAKFEEMKYFEACLPIDLMAERGVDTPRFGPMKPIGLEREDGTIPYACVQLRRENLLGSAFNLVGFQTRLKYPEQKRVFRLIPGLENASFLHLGSVHRNSFLNARTLLNFDLSAKAFPNIFFAGQMTGVEGYTESASMGLYVASQVARQLKGKQSVSWPVETAIGALINYLMTVTKPAPSNINFGLLPPVTLSKEQRRDRKNRKRIKKELAAARAREIFDSFWEQSEC